MRNQEMFIKSPRPISMVLRFLNIIIIVTVVDVVVKTFTSVTENILIHFFFGASIYFTLMWADTNTKQNNIIYLYTIYNTNK